MRHDNEQEHAVHDRQVAAVQSSVGQLPLRTGFAAEAVFEGAVKGAAIALMAISDASADDVAGMLENIAESFKSLDLPKMRVVQ